MVEKQKCLTSTPCLISEKDFPNLLRPREFDKEIQHGMYYKANSEVERIVETLKANSRVGGIEKESIRNIDGLLGGKTSSNDSVQSISRRKLSPKTIAKNVFPDLHSKTHFQAVLSLVHNASKTLMPDVETYSKPTIVKQTTNEDGIERADEEGNSGENTSQVDNTEIKEETKRYTHAVSNSLPNISLLSLKTISPLKEKKSGQESLRDPEKEKILRNYSKFRTKDKYASVLKDTDKPNEKLPKIQKNISFKLPVSSSVNVLASIPVDPSSETEKLAKKILERCNVFPNVPKKNISRQLHKGEGHTVSTICMGKEIPKPYEH